MKWPFLSLVTHFCLEVYCVSYNTGTPAFLSFIYFWDVCMVYIFPYFNLQSLCLLIFYMWLLITAYIWACLFCCFSVYNLHLLSGSISPFTFNIIINLGLNLLSYYFSFAPSIFIPFSFFLPSFWLFALYYFIYPIY